LIRRTFILLIIMSLITKREVGERVGRKGEKKRRVRVMVKKNMGLSVLWCRLDTKKRSIARGKWHRAHSKEKQPASQLTTRLPLQHFLSPQDTQTLQREA